MPTLNNSNSTLNTEVTLTRQSGTKITFDTNNKYVSKDI